MINQLKPYPAYKSSGVDWLGDIPNNWEIYRFKYLLSELESGMREEGGGNQLDEGIFSLGGEHISWGGKLLIDTPKFISQDFYHNLSKGKVRTNDVLLVKDGATIGKAAIIREMPFEHCAINEHVFILRTNNETDPIFLYYLVVSIPIQSQIYNLIKGSAQPGLNSAFIGLTMCCVPPLSEQKAIADFLDHHTIKIDALIVKLDRLVELLQEKRNALISQAVTKGLDLSVPMKDSGIEWLGEIPAHWELKRAKYIFEKLNRPAKDDEGVVTAFRDGQVTLRANRREDGFTFSIKEIGYQGVRKGDLVIHEMDGFAGAIGVSESDGKCSPIYSICSAKIPSNHYYYANLIRHMALCGFITSLAKGIRERSTDFRFKTFGNLILPIPPLSEQNSLEDKITKNILDIDNYLDNLFELKRLLLDKRSSLISQVVTGKIDVRDFNE